MAAFALACAFTASVAAKEVPLPDSPPAETRIVPFIGDLPGCDDSSALARIQDDFYHRERDYWQSDLAIESFLGMRETGLRSNGASYIPRRYCEARALFNDSRERDVIYQIGEIGFLGEGIGFLGTGPGVTWCVVGLDRNYAFSPDCRGAGR
jgi:hypothetical protein